MHWRWSLVIFGAGVLCGALAVAGYGRLSVRDLLAGPVPPEDVALVNRHPLLRTDFIARTETERHKSFGEATPAERLKTLNAMIREELLVQRGVAIGLPDTDPETREALVAAVQQRVDADVTTHPPTEAQLLQYFRDNSAHYATEGSMTLHDFRLPAGPDALAAARTAAAALKAGTAPAEAMKGFGLQEVVPQHAGAEQFYFAQQIHLGDALFARALKLDDGQVSDPVAAADGVHILMMVKHTRPVPLQFERIRSQVLNDYVAAAKQRLEDAAERVLRAGADIRIADDLSAAYAAGQMRTAPPAEQP